jgi:predicted nucleic acid-binding protein
VPDLFSAEFVNVMWKAVRKNRLNREEAEAALAAIRDLDLPSVPSALLMSEAFAIAMAYDRSVYDCIYLTLAIEAQCEMITADRKLVNAVSGQLPVRWLGDL